MSLTKQPEAHSSTAITTRLVVFYLVSTLLILFSTNWFQFRALSDDLDFEDNDFLVERLTTLRSIIARHPDALKDQIQSDPHLKSRYLVRVQDKEGRPLLQSPGMSRIPVESFPPAVRAGETIARGVKHLGADNRSYLLSSAWAEGSGDPYHRLVQVALDVTEEDALRAKYLYKMALSVSIGLLLAAGMGIFITRRGLRPLQSMAATVAQITESDLHQRIRAGSWPKELDQLTIALDTMLGRLEESFARLTEFSANLAHELRTPLNNLRGEAEVALSRARSNDEYRRIIESSMEEYERLSRTVGDILFLARPDQGHLPQTIEVGAEMETLAEYYRNLADEQQTTITIKGNAKLSVDPHLFQRAVGNVISNALHYTTSGGRITVSILPAGDGSLEIAIADDGMGIAPSELPLIFDRFYRSPQARLRHNQGSGLGLAIVSSIMALHGGTVTVSSKPGAGTAVTLKFPRQEPPPAR